MGYKESLEGRRYLDRLKRLGKDECLVPYTYNPLLQRVMDATCVLLIIVAIVTVIVLDSWLYFVLLEPHFIFICSW